MELAIMLESASSLPWPRWVEMAAATERLGFSGLYVSDHFGQGDTEPFEVVTALAYLAGHSRILRFGTLVSPLSIRDPVMLTRQAMMINTMSGGRMVLGIGAGWNEGEHAMFGYHLGGVAERMARLEEGAQVIRRLLCDDGPVTFEGCYYHLREAHLRSRPQRPVTLLIGGNGLQRTLPITSRYADVWNCVAVSAGKFQELSGRLDILLRQAGRDPCDVKRTVYVPVFCWCNVGEVDTFAKGIKRFFHWADHPTEKVIKLATTRAAAVIGTPDCVINQLRTYEAAGVDELVVGIWGAENVDYLERLATLILPQFGR